MKTKTNRGPLFGVMIHAVSCQCKAIQPPLEQGLPTFAYCPLHGAASELLEMLAILKDCFTDNDGECANYEATISRDTLKQVEALIRKVEGK